MKEDKVLVAISHNEDKVLTLKNVTKDEYDRLVKKEQELEHNKEREQLVKEKQFNIWKNDVDYKLEKSEKKDLILAKSIYDNFVDRGLLENDDAFQQMWFDFYFNDAKLELENAPEEYKTILKKVGELK